MKHISLILLVLITISCKQKAKTKWKFIAPPARIKSMNVDGESYRQIVKKMVNMPGNPIELEAYMAGFSGKVKYLPNDSLIPGVFPMALFADSYAYSVSWGGASANNRQQECVDTITDKKGRKYFTIRWKDIIEGQIIFPERGIVIYMDVPYAYRYNPVTGGYNYFLSKEDGKNCKIAVSGQALGELAYPASGVLNFYNEEQQATGDGVWVDGIVTITERRLWMQFTDSTMKFVYDLDAATRKKEVEAEPGHTLETTARSSELFDIEFRIHIKTPDEIKRIPPGRENYYTNGSPPSPVYILTASGKNLGIPHN